MNDNREQFRPIIAAMNDGDKQRARDLLRPILKTQPSADAWYLAARLAPNQERAHTFLEKALDLDPFHEPSIAALNRLSSQKPRVPQKHLPREYVYQPEPPKRQSRVGCLLVLITLVCIVGYLISPRGGTQSGSNTCAGCLNWWSTVRPVFTEFVDTYEVASSTPKLTLAPLIRELQTIRREFQNINTPSGARTARSYIDAAMNECILAFQTFMAGQDSTANLHFDRMADYLENTNEELARMGLSR